MAEPEVIA
jgi:hypothetical protein